jgi:SAM-dependent methyltransferase
MAPHSTRAEADDQVIRSFGEQWQQFRHDTSANDADLRAAFESYFSVFPWHELPRDAVGADVGCGTGRWARHVAPRVHRLLCFDPSDAIDVARESLATFSNVECRSGRADALPLDDRSLDFAYCLGVLHHVQDTEGALRSMTTKLKTGAPLLLYLYYSLENRPGWYSALWKISNPVRIVMSKMPFWLRHPLSQLIAALVYFPLARMAWLGERLGFNVSSWPLAFYRNLGFYNMRTDALDRFGTRVEKRYSQQQIVALMTGAGLTDIQFSNSPPYWCVVGRRRD